MTILLHIDCILIHYISDDSPFFYGKSKKEDLYRIKHVECSRVLNHNNSYMVFVDDIYDSCLMFLYIDTWKGILHIAS